MSGTVAEGLRGWARGVYAEEAAVELLLRCFGGRFASAGWPWIRTGEEPGSWWLDPDALVAESGALSSGGQRVLSVVASLAGGPRVDLFETVAGLDRRHLRLVLAAVSHAGGSHQHSDVRRGLDGSLGVCQLGPLVPWPVDDPEDGEAA